MYVIVIMETVNIINQSKLQQNIPLYFFNDNNNIEKNFKLIENVEAALLCKKWLDMFSFCENNTDNNIVFKDKNKTLYLNYFNEINYNNMHINGYKYIIWTPYIGNNITDKFTDNICIIKYITTFNSIKIIELIFNPLWEINVETNYIDIKKIITKYFISYAKYKFIKFD